MRRGRMALLASLGIGIISASLVAQDRPDGRKAGARPAVKQSALPMKTQPRAPQTYGTGISYYRLPSSMFTPVDTAADAYSDSYYTDLSSYYFRRYGTVGSAWFVGIAQLPSGARLVGLELDGCGGAGGGDLAVEVYNCSYSGDCGVAGAVATFNATAGCGSDSFDLSGLNLVVDNFSNEFAFKIVTVPSDGSANFAGIILTYQLQVSPAPGVGDVPGRPDDRLRIPVRRGPRGFGNHGWLRRRFVLSRHCGDAPSNGDFHREGARPAFPVTLGTRHGSAGLRAGRSVSGSRQRGTKLARQRGTKYV